MDPLPTTAVAMARVARQQHGVVTRSQLLSAGLSAQQIRDRVRSGGLIKVHRGVYRTGHDAPSDLASYMAAVLAAGPDAFLAGKAAAHLLGLTRDRPPQPEVLVHGRRAIPGITIKRTRRPLPGFERFEWRGIPCTSPARTLVDCAASANEEELGRAVHEAIVKHRLKPHHVKPVLNRRPNAAGAAFLKAMLWGDAPIILSRMEREFVRQRRERGGPLPLTNRPAGTKYVDCRWPEHKLTVELDSYVFHVSRRSWEQGYIRERQARDRGDEFRRYRWADVYLEPEPMHAEIDRLIRRTGR